MSEEQKPEKNWQPTAFIALPPVVKRQYNDILADPNRGQVTSVRYCEGENGFADFLVRYTLDGQEHTDEWHYVAELDYCRQPPGWDYDAELRRILSERKEDK